MNPKSNLDEGSVNYVQQEEKKPLTIKQLTGPSVRKRKYPPQRGANLLTKEIVAIELKSMHINVIIVPDLQDQSTFKNLFCSFVQTKIRRIFSSEPAFLEHLTSKHIIIS